MPVGGTTGETLKDFKPASGCEKEKIRKTLNDATTHAESTDLLYGFPWKSTRWFLATLEEGDLEGLNLFWDGGAWGERGNRRRRTLSEGLRGFVKLSERSPDQWGAHLCEIIGKRGNLGRNAEPFLILTGMDESGPFVILDGNHRAVALLWNGRERGSRENWPTQVWVGLSPEMPKYRHWY